MTMTRRNDMKREKNILVMTGAYILINLSISDNIYLFSLRFKEGKIIIFTVKRNFS